MNGVLARFTKNYNCSCIGTGYSDFFTAEQPVHGI